MDTLRFLDEKHLLLKCLAGSRAYGTATPDSDIDYRGIFIADPINYRTPFFPVEQITDTNEQDTVYYELSKFVKLYLDCNPNIIELLWVDESDILTSSNGYRYLRSHREKLLSSKVAFTFSGYAFAQLKRIKGHNKWINMPQREEPPKPSEFLTVVQWFGEGKNLKPHLSLFREGHRFVPYGDNLFGVHEAPLYCLWNTNGDLNINFQENRENFRNPLMLVKWNREEYITAKEKHEQYWAWKRNRNEKRSVLEEQFGYDVKHAMHLVRLLRMGVEILETGVVHVKRPDADELRAIRNGAWTYEEIVKYAEEMDIYVREVLYKRTSLLKYPDVHFAAQLLMDIQDICWDKKI